MQNNYVKYNNEILMKGSKAYELYQLWRAKGTPESKKVLESHMKDVDQRYKALLGLK